MKILARMEKSKDCWFLIAVSVIFFLLRIPSFIEPYWYGDEGIYQIIGVALASGRLLYRDIWDNKPPLLYVLYSLFSTDQFSIRLLSALFGVCSVITFYMLSQKLFQKRGVIYITTSLFAMLFALPLLEGNIANSENFMLLPILLAGLLIYIVTNQSKNKNSLLFLAAGLLLSAAFLFKVVAVFDLAAFSLFLFITSYPKKNFIDIAFIVSFFKRIFGLITGFFLPIVITVLFFILQGALSDFLHAAFVANVGYIGYGNKLIISQGFLIIKLLLLIGFVFFLFLKRTFLPKPYLFIFLWFSFALFNAFFSGRPYTHYLLVLLPSFCLFLGMSLDTLHQSQALWGKMFQKVLIGFLIFTVVILGKSFWIYSKNVAYYKNFFLFLTNRETVASYRMFFDSKTQRDYELASLLHTLIKNDKTLFIWGNNAQLYVLTHTLPPGKYTVVYHMLSSQKSIQETISTLTNKKPTYIIIMPNVEPLPYSLYGYSQKYMIDGAFVYEKNS